MSPRKTIIDTDPGQDDAVAILLALASPEEIEVLGIVAVAGNVNWLENLMSQSTLGVINLWAGRLSPRNMCTVKPVLMGQCCPIQQCRFKTSTASIS
jgi:purine nucleosidase